MVGIISVVIGGHFAGGDRFDGGDHFGGGTGIMPELRCLLKNDDRTPILFKREVCCGRQKDKALELVTYILLKSY